MYNLHSLADYTYIYKFSSIGPYIYSYKMTLPNKRNYKSLKHNKVDTHGTSSKTKTRKSIANPPNLKSLQDALDYCNSNLNLLQLHQTDKNKNCSWNKYQRRYSQLFQKMSIHAKLACIVIKSEYRHKK